MWTSSNLLCTVLKPRLLISKARSLSPDPLPALQIDSRVQFLEGCSACTTSASPRYTRYETSVLSPSLDLYPGTSRNLMPHILQALLGLGGLIGFISKGSTASLGMRTCDAIHSLYPTSPPTLKSASNACSRNLKQDLPSSLQACFPHPCTKPHPSHGKGSVDTWLHLVQVVVWALPCFSFFVPMSVSKAITRDSFVSQQQHCH